MELALGSFQIDGSAPAKSPRHHIKLYIAVYKGRNICNKTIARRSRTHRIVEAACQIASKCGSDALLVMLASPEADDAGLQEIKFSAAIHLPLDELELADLPLGLTVGPSRNYRGAYSGNILCDAVGE